MSKAKLLLRTANTQLEIPLSRALWIGYGIPLTFAVLYIIFGLEGLLGALVISTVSLLRR